MNKAILVLAAALATGTLAQPQAAEASGLRIGFGFGIPFATRPQIADPSILENAERAKQRRIARERGSASPEQRPSSTANAAAAKREKQAAAREAQRQAAAAAKVQAAKPIQTAKPVTAPVLPQADKATVAAQAQQRKKADDLLTSLKPTAAITPRQAGGETAPAEVAVPGPVAPPVKVVEPPVKVAAPVVSAPIVTGECRRFIPGAGVTVSVSCSE